MVRDGPETSGARAIVLVGHGSVPGDFPRPMVQRLRTLEQERRKSGGPISTEERELDTRLRHWPRTQQTDPYGAGVRAIAEALRARAGRVVVAYNESCAPSLEEAVGSLVCEGVAQITVVTTMLTPGGVHSEVDIPESIRGLEESYPAVELRYAWPFNLDAVAGLLADACRAAEARPR